MGHNRYFSPSGIQFASPLALEKKYGYLDKIIFVGKDFSFGKSKWLTGISVGLARSSLLRGKQYIQGVEVSPSSVFGNSLPQFHSPLGSLSLNLFLVSWGVILLFKEMFTADGMELLMKVIAIIIIKPRIAKIFGEQMWNYGIGIRYTFVKKSDG